MSATVFGEKHETFPTVLDIFFQGRGMYEKTWGLCQHRVDRTRACFHYVDREWELVVSLEMLKRSTKEQTIYLPCELRFKYWVDMQRGNILLYGIEPDSQYVHVLFPLEREPNKSRTARLKTLS